MVFNYSASKAALHSFILCMREQLKQKPECRIKVTELVTPLVQSKFPFLNPRLSVQLHQLIFLSCS
jgi:short-subunit dehydrogenase involved in D-alanine esterification of teichoic acids